MAITESDSTVGEIVNEVGSKLASVSADVQRWAAAVDAALAVTPDSGAPEPADPSLQLQTQIQGRSSRFQISQQSRTRVSRRQGTLIGISQRILLGFRRLKIRPTVSRSRMCLRRMSRGRSRIFRPIPRQRSWCRISIPLQRSTGLIRLR